MMDEVRITDPTTGGQKGSKPARYDLIPVKPLRAVAELYGKGAEKYDERNWERGYKWSLSYAAAQRHLNQWWEGESLDSETRCHHLASVIFHCLAQMEFERTHPELDDRPASNRNAQINAVVSQAMERVNSPQMMVTMPDEFAEQFVRHYNGDRGNPGGGDPIAGYWRETHWPSNQS